MNTGTSEELDNGLREEIEAARRANNVFIGLEYMQIITFLIGLLFYFMNATKFYLFLTWFEDGLCEIIMIFLIIYINSVL